MDYYKGYIKCDGKKPLQKFANGEPLLTEAQVEEMDSYAGILADGIILFGFDDVEQGEVMWQIVQDEGLQCRVYKTARGYHFLFADAGGNKCGVNKFLACGMRSDIKVGGHNCYESLRVNGEERELLQDAETPDVYPKFLTPMYKGKDLWKLAEGSRNSILYAYIATLTGKGFSKIECEYTIRIINKYVFASPLSDEEMNTICREEAFPEPAPNFYVDGKLMHNVMGDYLRRTHNIKKINGLLHIYRDGFYQPSEESLEMEMINLAPTIKDTQRREVMKYLRVICNDDRIKVADARYVCFKNGVYDLSDHVLRPHTPDIVITNMIPHVYNPNAYSEVGEKMLERIANHDKEIQCLLEECLGYPLLRNSKLRKFPLLIGEKGNGKSSFFEMLEWAIGEDNTSHLSMNEIGERFSMFGLVGKLLNIGDDIPSGMMDKNVESKLKILAAGGKQKYERKGYDVESFENIAKMFFSANVIPRSGDETGAVTDRMVIIPLRNRFRKGDPDYDPWITSKLKTEEVAEYLLRVGVEGLERIIGNEGFTECSATQEELEKYKYINHPEFDFIETEKERFVGKTTRWAYEQYKVWANDNGYRKMGSTKFKQTVEDFADLIVQSVNGQRVWCEK